MGKLCLEFLQYKENSPLHPRRYRRAMEDLSLLSNFVRLVDCLVVENLAAHTEDNVAAILAMLEAPTSSAADQMPKAGQSIFSQNSVLRVLSLKQ
jgi:hypothetical protein